MKRILTWLVATPVVLVGAALALAWYNERRWANWPTEYAVRNSWLNDEG